MIYIIFNFCSVLLLQLLTKEHSGGYVARETIEMEIKMAGLPPTFVSYQFLYEETLFA